MSQIGSLSKISKDLIDYSSYEHDIFSNYLEPQQNDLFDTRRFSLQNVKLEDLKTATPKMERNSSPARFLRKFSVRANSAKLISKSLYKGNGEAVASQGKLVKKVENLEKKQELWKERANVWEKERKHYQKAITSFTSEPSAYYKNQLENWKKSKFLKRVSDDAENLDPIEELKSFFEWVNSQPDSTPFKSIKLATTQYLTKLAKLESFIASKSSKEYDNFNEILQELSGKNQQLSSNLTQIEAELEEKSENLSKLQRKIQQLAFELAEKEAELDCKQMEKIRNADEKRKIVELLSEIESKSYEILVLTTENQGLSSGLKQAQSSNLAYIEAIEDLKQKLKMMRLKDGKSHENTLRRRNSSGIPLESLISEGSDSGKKPFPVKKHLGRPKRSPGNQLINKDFLAFTSCLASAVEALINQDGN